MLRNGLRVTKLAVFMIALVLYFQVQAMAVQLSKEEQSLISKEVLFQATLYKDYQQTFKITKSKYHYETNKLLGRHPHKDNVRIYMAGCSIGHALITYCLYKANCVQLATLWQDVWILTESQAGYHNDNHGLDVHNRTNHNYVLTYTWRF